GLRAGELFGLEVKHFNGDTITVAQSVWEGRVQTPKTVNAFRQVDLHPTVASKLRDFIADRKEGFLFRTRTGTPFLQSNFLRVAVGTLVTQRPPHGSARAAFLHAALTADIWRRSAYQDTDEEAWVAGASA